VCLYRRLYLAGFALPLRFVFTPGGALHCQYRSASAWQCSRTTSSECALWQ
jgi:hypothetical protein